MQTSIVNGLLNEADRSEADRILRTCTHCGFCTATCPTYQLLGDERDGPRGRIYLIKKVLEGEAATERTRRHLDRCLTCRACETTCPSGVEYAKLLDIGREVVDEQAARPWSQRVVRWLLRHVVAYRKRFAFVCELGWFFRPALVGPLAGLSNKLPARPEASSWPEMVDGARTMLIHEGCVQPVISPGTNARTARLFARLGIRVIAASNAGCCGAISQHLSHRDEALDWARRNIDAWWPYIEQGAEAIIITASGCGASIADYGYLLRDDPLYAQKAARVSELTRDLSDVLAGEDLSILGHPGTGRRVAYHPPCTLRNAPALHDHVATILRKAGYELTQVRNAHLCCGSAGTYSILQPELSMQLRGDKLDALAAGEPEAIVTANIGCQMHLAAGTAIPVRHWVELLEP